MRNWSIVAAIVGLVAFILGRRSRRLISQVQGSVPIDKHPAQVLECAELVPSDRAARYRNWLAYNRDFLDPAFALLVTLVAAAAAISFALWSNQINDDQRRLLARQIEIQHSQSLPIFEVHATVQSDGQGIAWIDSIEITNIGGFVRDAKFRFTSRIRVSGPQRWIPPFGNYVIERPDASGYAYLDIVGFEPETSITRTGKSWLFPYYGSGLQEFEQGLKSVPSDVRPDGVRAGNPETVFTVTYIDFVGTERAESYLVDCSLAAIGRVLCNAEWMSDVALDSFRTIYEASDWSGEEVDVSFNPNHSAPIDGVMYSWAYHSGWWIAKNFDRITLPYGAYLSPASSPVAVASPDIDSP